MNIRTELFLAWRFLKPKRNAISIITLISIIGVSLGVCVLMVVFSIMTGYTSEMESKILDFTPHIQIKNRYSNYIENPNQIIKAVDSLGIGASASPRTEGQVLVQKDKDIVPQLLIGINDKYIDSKSFITEHLAEGSANLGSGEILISHLLSDKYDLEIGSTLLINAPSQLESMLNFDSEGNLDINNDNISYTPTQFTVKGIYNIGLYDYDNYIVITNQNDADKLFGFPANSATMISIKTKNPFNIEALYNELSNLYPSYQIMNWKQLKQPFLNLVEQQKNMMFFVLVFIVIVAASSITNTLITVVVQKTGEIGLMRAIGASSGTIMRIFIYQGFWVGVVGTIIGLVTGGLVVLFRQNILDAISFIFNIEVFPEQFYNLSSLPALIVPRDIIVIGVCSIFLCTLAAFLPAFRASRLDPAKAIRQE